MKKLCLIAVGILSAVALVYAAQQTLDDQDATKVGLPSLVTKVNANFTELYTGLTATVTLTNITHLIIENGRITDTSPTSL